MSYKLDTLVAANNMINMTNVAEFISEYGSIVGSYELTVLDSYPVKYIYSILDNAKNKIMVGLSFYDFIEIAYSMKLHQYDRFNIGYNMEMTKHSRAMLLKAYYENECVNVNFRLKKV